MQHTSTTIPKVDWLINIRNVRLYIRSCMYACIPSRLHSYIHAFINVSTKYNEVDVIRGSRQTHIYFYLLLIRYQLRGRLQLRFIYICRLGSIFSDKDIDKGVAGLVQVGYYTYILLFQYYDITIFQCYYLRGCLPGSLFCRTYNVKKLGDRKMSRNRRVCKDCRYGKSAQISFQLNIQIIELYNLKKVCEFSCLKMQKGTLVGIYFQQISYVFCGFWVSGGGGTRLFNAFNMWIVFRIISAFSYCLNTYLLTRGPKLLIVERDSKELLRQTRERCQVKRVLMINKDYGVCVLFCKYLNCKSFIEKFELSDDQERDDFQRPIGDFQINSIGNFLCLLILLMCVFLLT
eukprot:TRINITY_DN2254_c0_g1_i16.p1 TRINITY_DN2254_c0_g1~~TRINITY_DN2254_c0_g1_i16.p1  ORF type:complete len:347 (-),score=-13.64 TRINITY_DN2254_c0_g1_i16:176-1216(-)